MHNPSDTPEHHANREVVEVLFDVEYDALGHDMILQARLKTVEPETYLLQVWLKDKHPSIWLPELRPYVTSAVEFDASQQVTSAMCELFDSKWRREGSGQRYVAPLWGYVQQQGNPVQFSPFEKEFVYP